MKIMYDARITILNHNEGLRNRWIVVDNDSCYSNKLYHTHGSDSLSEDMFTRQLDVSLALDARRTSRSSHAGVCTMRLDLTWWAFRTASWWHAVAKLVVFARCRALTWRCISYMPTLSSVKMNLTATLNSQREFAWHPKQSEITTHEIDDLILSTSD